MGEDSAHLEVKYMSPSELVPYINNAKIHEPQQIDKIAASIKEFGFNNPILLDGEKGIIAGHGRLEAAQKLNMKIVPTIDLSHLTDVQRRAYMLADNRLAEVDTSWNVSLVESEFEGLKLEGFDAELTGFTEMFFKENWDDDKDEPPDDFDQTEEEYKVLVLLETLEDQARLLERLAGEGYRCKTVKMH